MPQPRPSFSHAALAAREGFTLVEMILAVAVMAILASITAPPLTQFMRQRDIRAEQVAQLEIQRALRAYEQQNLTFPSDAIGSLDPANAGYANNWFAQLAPYTRLPVNKLLFDTWGNERRYVATTLTTTLGGVTVPVSYATLISAGPDTHVSNGCGNANANGSFTDNAVAGGAINGFVPASNTAYQWKAQANVAVAFAGFACVGSGRDEILLKTTDLADKILRYQTTLRRLNDVTTALESYSKARQSEAQTAFATAPNTVLNGSGTPTPPAQMIYYPRGQLPGQSDDPVSHYNLPVLNALAAAASGNADGNTVVNTALSNPERYSDLIALMRLLGLPDTDCCSALEQFTNGGTTFAMPLYYASNPRPVTTGGACGARPDPTAGGVTLPARVSTIPPGGNGTAADPCY